jgi:hypothetical protein
MPPDRSGKHYLKFQMPPSVYNKTIILLFLVAQTKQKEQIMFTIEQIKEAHSKVKSGADFPVYI